MASDEPKGSLAREQTRAHIGSPIGPSAIGGAFALRLINFALLFVWSLWSASSTRPTISNPTTLQPVLGQPTSPVLGAAKSVPLSATGCTLP